MTNDSTPIYNDSTPIYEVSFHFLWELQAHSLSNAGSNGTNRMYRRHQLLADGSEVDAYSGNLAKHVHADILSEILQESGQPLCEFCAVRDRRRAGALAENREMSAILQCGLCDAHGFLLLARKGSDRSEERKPKTKHTLIDFSFALACPGHYNESTQLFTRSHDDNGDGQMVMKVTARSGQYAMVVRYKCVGIGVDTDTWQLLVENESDRLVRHQAVLRALRDQMLSPGGAMTAKMMPHLTGLGGAILVRTTAGRAPTYSPLQSDYITQLEQIAVTSELYQLYRFDTVAQFHERMDFLIQHTRPTTPSKPKLTDQGVPNGNN